MKRIVLVCLITVFAISNCNADSWFRSLNEAKKMALASNKLILVDFWATWCGPCKAMDSNSWSKEDVKLLMNNYISVKIDIDENRDIAAQYGVKGIPYIFIMDGNGKVIYNQMSYKSKSDVIHLLKKYALSTAFLKQDLINYYKKPEFANSFRLGKKYQDYCLLLNEDLKYEFLKLAEIYLNESSKLLKKSGLKNKKVFKQQLELLEIQEKLILNKPGKSIKMLDKINVASLEEMNKSFYNALYYIAYKELNSAEEIKNWSLKVNESVKKRAELFLKSS